MFQESVKTKMPFHMRPVLRRLLVALVCAACLMNQAAAAKVPISKQLTKIRPGTAIQVNTTDGRTLEGKLVSTSKAAFELLEQGQQNVKTIECADVVTVSVVREPSRKRGSRLVTTLMVVGYFAATGIAIVVGGGIY